MASVRDILDERGGPNAVARALTVAGYAKPGKTEFPRTTVWGWAQSNKIPHWWLDRVLKLPPQPKQGRGKARAA